MATTPVLTTSAYVLHNLGLAAGFGGSLFGKTALNPSVRLVSDQMERSKVVNAAWNGYNVLNGIALGATALTWVIGRFFLKGRELSREVRGLVVAKDWLTGATLATGLASMIGGISLAKKAREGRAPMESGSKASEAAPEDVKRLTGFVNRMGIINLVCLAGVIGVSTWLDNTAATSSRWPLIARILP